MDEGFILYNHNYNFCCDKKSRFYKLEAMVGSIFPVLSKQYWYFTAYTGAFMFFPILNLALEKMERKQIEKILLAMMFMFSLFSTIFQTIYKSDIFILNDGYSVWWLVVLYLLGGYIGKYGILKTWRRRHLLEGYLILSI